VSSYIDKVDQYKSIGNDDFLYDSLRYFGEPSEKDIRNAHFILHLPEQGENDDANNAQVCFNGCPCRTQCIVNAIFLFLHFYLCGCTHFDNSDTACQDGNSLFCPYTIDNGGSVFR
jgi:hypothetical protein